MLVGRWLCFIMYESQITSIENIDPYQKHVVRYTTIPSFGNEAGNHCFPFVFLLPFIKIVQFHFQKRILRNSHYQSVV